MQRNSSILIGLFAGLAAGLMLAAAIFSGMSGFLLFFVATGAIYIATMGWGFAAGLAASFAGAVTAYLMAGLGLAGAGLVLLFFPAAAVGHMLNLGQRADNGTGIVWYPLSGILFRLMLMLGAGFIALGASVGYTPEAFVPEFAQLLGQMQAANPQVEMPDDEALREWAAFYANMVPVIIPCLWLLCHVMIAFLSAGITRRSGLMARDPEDIAATVTLPPEAILVLVAGLTGVLLFDGAIGAASAVLTGLGIAGFGLVGLAQLHYRTRPMAARGLILGAVYASLVLFSFPLLIFTLLGITRSLRTARNMPGGGSGNPGNPSNHSSNSSNEE